MNEVSPLDITLYLISIAHIINSASPHPRVMGIVNECGGKIHMVEHQWSQATANFLEAFKNYDEVGNDQRCIRCLKYLGLANMLMESQVNPFDGQEANS
ncbi:hypothetical protein Fmac_001684 [Flemingia macrophylla]|uniref:Uncharacterized protein n=1 Tax=Flemingia macrophylla TaxID=520843 RepID=A0ABD1NHU2_9FABA